MAPPPVPHIHAICPCGSLWPGAHTLPRTGKLRQVWATLEQQQQGSCERSQATLHTRHLLGAPLALVLEIDAGPLSLVPSTSFCPGGSGSPHPHRPESLPSERGQRRWNHPQLLSACTPVSLSRGPQAGWQAGVSGLGIWVSLGWGWRAKGTHPRGMFSFLGRVKTPGGFQAHRVPWTSGGCVHSGRSGTAASLVLGLREPIRGCQITGPLGAGLCLLPSRSSPTQLGVGTSCLPRTKIVDPPLAGCHGHPGTLLPWPSGSLWLECHSQPPPQAPSPPQPSPPSSSSRGQPRCGPRRGEVRPGAARWAEWDHLGPLWLLG